MQLLDINMLIINNLQDAERVLQTVPTNELFVVNDPELELVLLIYRKNSYICMNLI